MLSSDLLLNISLYFTIGYIGRVCQNFNNSIYSETSIVRTSVKGQLQLFKVLLIQIKSRIHWMIEKRGYLYD